MVFLLVVDHRDASTWASVAAVIGLLSALADQMLKLAYIDELTGLPQRRALVSQLQHLRRRSAVCVLQRRGHAAGV